MCKLFLTLPTYDTEMHIFQDLKITCITSVFPRINKKEGGGGGGGGGGD